jgi:DNA-binding NarL/FixJ family response regulator
MGDVAGAPLGVLVVYDRRPAPPGLHTILGPEPRVGIVGEAFTHHEAITFHRNGQPDVVLIDALAQAIDARYLTERLTRADGAPPARILVLVDEMDDLAWDIMRGGARGILLKQSRPDQLIAALELVAADYTLFRNPSPPRRGIQMPRWGGAQPETVVSACLTAREVEVLKLIGQAYSNARISRELKIQESTVKSHVRSLLEKLALQNRVQAALYALRAGLVEPEDAGSSRE